MQDRYTGDIGDYGKLGLLRCLAASGLRVGVNWYRTPDEDHNEDGKFIQCEQIRASGATPVLYATWAYRKGSGNLSAKGWGYDEMSRALSAAYRQAARENRALLADVGRRFYELADARDLYAPDGVHPTKAGSRLAAETIAAAIQNQKEN